MEYGWRRPKVFDLTDPQAIVDKCKALPGSDEGYVVLFEDGERFKFKGDAYLALHRLLSVITPRRILELHKLGQIEFQRFKDAIPDEFLPEFNRICKEIYQKLDDTWRIINDAWLCTKFDGVRDNRKDFALYVMNNYPQHAPYLFARLDGKSDSVLTTMIYNKEFDY